ncbi:LEM3 (ligand-effect modulator 3) family / CDC50 family, putative [Trypanosoma equiperdum]|uniref:LEM3 (Ligand-effect modulator 3) family / CDC50 family n=4 Tax=Trypanozoon TaxID=39700 RepID=Q38DJ5_TRYB2|nr:hypothetical protein, conserved [Trypanosoma brucei gambiense DAL972]XP_827455.1 hypothetical protein, conserved [Trypanosoma brucei brucei TREU927]RHW70513.1 LEM3 (ligand-effect modulator 3) family / CDC50 family [Trypanosoma brucei equiperdum]SCU72890.1 LEM3 (ligand-effect modulator 3) family / CDC50 family, putative [Trypanosoma equiperdum]EAN77125.1 hypothetical protein, conserved [Trypanosoma brucei brucei TREU927]CBH14651.1 hypothetical protein, conserved [Trypanosoma brucei gambiense|eukprot:XP_011776917.1 hypothetical protein, conserved [Trypanosoma brucei gambiense DAL972]
MSFGRLLKQQRLPAWQLNLTPRIVCVILWTIAFICIPLGIFVEFCNRNAKEASFRYDNEPTKCTEETFSLIGGQGTGKRTVCETHFEFVLAETLRQPVYFYYGLTKMYQNHRRYTNSRSGKQLMGADVRSETDANPFVIPGDTMDNTNKPIEFGGRNHTYKDFVYVPVGLVAWSMFNDTFTLFRKEKNGSNPGEVLICNGTDFSRHTNKPLHRSVSHNHCDKNGIAWESDIKKKFLEPKWDGSGPVWTAPRSEYGKPSIESNDTYFNNGWYAGEEGHMIPVVTDEDFMVWMRASPLPNVRKLYRIIRTDLRAGKYVMKIRQNYNTKPYGGEKSFIFLQPSMLGGKLTSLSITYFAVGGLALIFTVLVLFASHVWGHHSFAVVERLLTK